MPSLINRSACKKFVLEIADSTRAKKFTRVSGDVFDHLESVMQKTIKDLVRSHPSVGTTVKMGVNTRSKSLNDCEYGEYG
jgi:hypothetical protein